MRPNTACVQACALALALLLGGGVAAKPPPPPLAGVVTQVIDGHTLRFTPPGQPALQVRLARIDAPALCQAWGPEARQALSQLALNKPATLQATGRDAQGLTLALLRVEGVDIGERLVEEGHAWSLRTRNDQGPLVKQERMAKALNRGLHAGGTALKPSDFRRAKGPCPDAAPR